MGREIPMDEPKGANVFQKWIKAVLAKNSGSKNCRFVATALLRGSDGGGLDPEANRSHHVLSDAQSDHRRFFVGKRQRVVGHCRKRFRQPSVATGERFVSGKAIAHAVLDEMRLKTCDSLTRSERVISVVPKLHGHDASGRLVTFQ